MFGDGAGPPLPQQAASLRCLPSLGRHLKRDAKAFSRPAWAGGRRSGGAPRREDPRRSLLEDGRGAPDLSPSRLRDAVTPVQRRRRAQRRECVSFDVPLATRQHQCATGQYNSPSAQIRPNSQLSKNARPEAGYSRRSFPTRPLSRIPKTSRLHPEGIRSIPGRRVGKFWYEPTFSGM